MRKHVLVPVVMMVASVCLAEAETMCIGYSESKFASGAPVGSGWGDNQWIETAIHIPASTVKLLSGNKITGINGWLNSIADVETCRIWLRSDLEGENLTEYTLVPNQLNNIKKGVNKLKFKNAWDIPFDFDSGLYIGFGHKIKSSNARGLSVNTTPIPGGFFLRGGDGVWKDYSDRGTACMELVIEGDNLPAHNARLSVVDSPDVFVNSKGNLDATVYAHNFGTQTINGFDVNVEIEGVAPMSYHIDDSLDPNALGIYKINVNPGELALGAIKVKYSIANLKDGEDSDNEDNIFACNMETVSHDYPRYVLAEEFTTEDCGNCPEVIKWVHELLDKPEFHNVIQVSHHAGYKTDFLTEPWHTTFMDMFGGGSFAPGVLADRWQREPNSIVFYPATSQEIADLWSKRLETPALVSVNVSAVYADEEHTKLHVVVEGEKSIQSICETPVVNVMLTESGIPMVKQASAPKGFVHDHVSRAVSGESHWGTPLVFDGDSYKYECEFDLNPEWKLENMDIVAYVGNNGNWKNKLIANAGSMKMSDVLGAGINAIETESSVVKIQYYDLSGVAVVNPRSGIYLKKTVMSDGRIFTEKCIVR